MKKLLYALLAASLIFSACKKEENISDSPFIGYWSGQYSGDYDGIWNGTISSTGDIKGIAIFENIIEIELNGTVTNSGIADFTTGTGSYGVDFIGELNGNSGNGTWISSTDTSNSTGIWQGNNYN